jgi:LDH2 family malate/lactate/ureidoglycolate dehydrogenase
MQVVAQANDVGLPLEARHIFLHQTVAGQAEVAEDPSPAIVRLPMTLRPPADSAEGHDGCVRVAVDSLRALAHEALTRAGLAPEVAAVVAEVQLEASLRGQPTHNVASIPRYARRVADGVIHRDPTLRVERETAVSAVVDGDNGPGQWVGVRAMELAIARAREQGIGVVVARNSNHFGAAGHYAWLAAQKDLIGLCTSNAPTWLAPTGGLTPTYGNNPLGVAIPAAGRYPIVLDVSMSVAAKGKIGLYLAEGRPLPAGWILDAAGRPSTDAADLAAGLGVPIGGHKGYGLTLVLEVLAGVLSGAAFGWDHRRERMKEPGRRADLGHFFLAIDPGMFLSREEFASRVERLIDQTKAGERVPGVDELLLPGEREMRSRERNLRLGVPLRRSALAALQEYKQSAGLTTELARAA